MRIRLLCTSILFFFVPVVGHAWWTGIAAFADQQESDWAFSAQTRIADSFRYGLRIEEKTSPGLRLGMGIGQFHLRLKALSNIPTIDKYDGEFVLFYMRWPFNLSDRLSLHTRFDYLYHSGRQSENSSDNEIDWIETAFSAGLRMNLGTVSLQPYVRFRSIDGDLTRDATVQLFDDAQVNSYGIKLDIHVEPTAYVRLHASFNATESLGVSFVREY